MITNSGFGPSATGSTAPRRIALYSHDTMGLGHIRRNLLIAQSLISSGLPVQILLVTGSREGSQCALPPGVDVLTLPAVTKNPAGRYQSRHLTMALPDMIELRSSAISAALDSFQPDLFVVDNVPRGVARELDPALEMLKDAGRTHCVLGLRDVLDEPVTVRQEWHRSNNFDVVRQYYDAVWVYGDPNVYDAVQEYAFPVEIAVKTQYLGYLDQRSRIRPPAQQTPKPNDPRCVKQPYVLCLLGGGQDGMRIAQAFLDADRPDGTRGVLVTGPMMPEEARAKLKTQARGHDDLTVLESVTDTSALIDRAQSVITMGGYNTVGEVLVSGKPALILPRVRPRQEQWIRATRLQEMGLLNALHPDKLSAEELGNWIAGAQTPRVAARTTIDMSGLTRLQTAVGDIIDDAPIRHNESNHEGIHHAAG